jgi:hypothetical protein
MKLYHGSTFEVAKPTWDFNKENPAIDFGIGFYTTSSFDQAMSWAKKNAKKLSFEKGQTIEATVTEFDFCDCDTVLVMKEFDLLMPEIDWLDYIADNRRQENFESLQKYDKFDLIVGPIANSDEDIFAITELYRNGPFTAEATIVALKPYTFVDQYVFKSDAGIQKLEFVTTHYGGNND